MALAGPNDSVAKGPVTICLDQISIRADARSRLEALRQAIIALAPAGYRGLEGVFAQYLFPGFFNVDQIARLSEYLGRYWFSEATGWWPEFQPIAPIYATGLLHTLNTSLAPKGAPLPIDSYWILKHHQVEMLNLVSARQVTLLIATPSPVELAPSGMWSEDSQAWVTTRRAGTTAGEVDPLTNTAFSRGTTDLRVRTHRIQARGSKGA
jgi:hypothetical protein